MTGFGIMAQPPLHCIGTVVGHAKASPDSPKMAEVRGGCIRGVPRDIKYVTKLKNIILAHLILYQILDKMSTFSSFSIL